MLLPRVIFSQHKAKSICDNNIFIVKKKKKSIHAFFLSEISMFPTSLATLSAIFDGWRNMATSCLPLEVGPGQGIDASKVAKSVGLHFNFFLNVKDKRNVR